jgi:Domain of unknown function (DUF4404)
MDKNSLRDHLAKLHAELADAHQADPQYRESLTEMMQDINRLIDKDAAATPLPGKDPSLPDRLERIAVQFEADHPTLAASARRLVDLLGEVGI